MLINVNEITPVQKIGAFYFKRDDMFKPYKFSPANGSKLRQAICLCQKNIELCKNGIYTGTSVLSPQAVICSTVAQAMNVPAYIVYGGTSPESLRKQKYASICSTLGAHIYIANSGYTTCVTSAAIKLAEKTGGYVIRYGFDLFNNLDVFIDSVAGQVENIPDNLDYLGITVGSAITLIGVLLGISRYNKKVGKIIAVGCAPNRMEKIKCYCEQISKTLGEEISLENLEYIDCFNNYKGFKYNDTKKEIYYGLQLHPRYEAKMFNFVKGYVPQEAKTLLWITGSDMQVEPRK